MIVSYLHSSQRLSYIVDRWSARARDIDKALVQNSKRASWNLKEVCFSDLHGGPRQESVHLKILTSQREIKEDYWVACSHG
jgi:hypothetical protein